jgi:hypothetical protein
LSVLSGRLSTGRRSRTGQNSSGILSVSRPVGNALPVRVDVENVTERVERLAESGGVCFVMRVRRFACIIRASVATL